MAFGPILPRSFYCRPAIDVARDLLGKVLIHGPTAGIAAGIIVETEAYLGAGDQAAHSARGVTPRTEVIFGPPGHAYVYFIYGMYECLNLVCEPAGAAGCVLIRSLEPVAGLDLMRRRRPAARKLVVREALRPVAFEIEATPRIGISQAAELPLRFLIRDNRFVSGARWRSALEMTGRRGAANPGRSRL